MATGAETIVSQPSGPVPYVGLRPFEPQERDRFFGRNRDAQILCDRVLASRVTILYALSGLGKSSLLKVLVIPKLEENQARLVYFDTWSQEDPLHALKETLAALASRLGVPGTGYGSLSLIELVRLVSSVDDRNLVLVFDQFEEFLVRHAQSLDPFRTELAALIRATKFDVSVVLTLREEFLAALEPFRQQILNLFQSAYRLEGLSKEHLVEAIREPARIFGGNCEPELADELVKDLRGGEADIAAGPQLSLGLPMLQLVCQELWKQAPDGQLSLALYERLGRARRIIDDYVRRVMPRERKAQNFTARLLIYLAPASNLKMSYSVEDLADITELPAAGIETELKRLATAGILRTREYMAGLRYELQHDAFIPVLRSWRNEVLERSRRRQWMLRMAGAAAMALVVLFAIGYGLYVSEKGIDRVKHEALIRNAAEREAKLQREAAEKEKDLRQLADLKTVQAEASRKKLEGWETGGLLDELDSLKGDASKALAPARVDELTSYLLLKRNDEQRLLDLKKALQHYERYIPADYAEPAPDESGSAEGAPLSLTYSSARPLDPAHFMIVWRNFGKEVTRSYGIPVPLQIHFETGDIPKEQLKFSGAETKAVAVDVPANEEQYLVRYPLDKLAPGSAKEFLEHFQADWVIFAYPQWRLVPKWSLPVWKLAKGMTKSTDVPEWYEIATSPSGITAYRALLNLLEKDNPKIFFSEPAARFLLHNVPQSYRTTLDEAVAARGGDCLASEVAGRMQKMENAFALPAILDELADQPADQPCTTLEASTLAAKSLAAAKGGPNTGSSGEAEAKADRLKGHADSNLLHGPWPATDRGLRQLSGRDYQIFSGLEGSLPQYLPVQVYVGEALANTWIPNNRPSQSLAIELDQLRDDLYRQYGVDAPIPTFSDSPVQGNAPPSHAIRIQVTRDPVEPGTLLELVNGERVMKGSDPMELVAALRSSYEGTRPFWITPEKVQTDLKALPDGTQAWLQARYSITDLKKLLRMTVGYGGSDEGASVRYTSWLLNSLVFWTTGDESLNAAKIRDHLRHLQEMRMGRHAARGVSDGVRAEIERGVGELVDDHTDLAVGDFKSAVAQDREGASEAFCAAWRRRLPEVWLRDHRQEFSSLRDLKIEAHDRLDLQDLPVTGDWKPAPKIARELKIYRLAAGPTQQNEMAAVGELLSGYSSADEWPAEQARWTAVRFLSQYDPTDPRTGNQREFEAATALIKGAIKSQDQQGAFDAFSDVEKLSWTRPDNGQYRSTPNWCWHLMSDLAESRPRGAPLNLQLELAWQLADQERLDRLRQSQSLLGSFEQVLHSSQLTADERAQQEDLVTYTRARVDRALPLVQDDDAQAAEAERLFRALLKAKRNDIRQASCRELVRMLYEQGRDKDAQRLIEELGNAWSDDPYARAVDMFAQLQRGNGSAVIRIAETEKKKAEEQAKLGNKDDANGSLFYAALGLMVMQSGDWQNVVARFINEGTQHQYRDYVVMMFYAYSPQRDSAGTALFDQRWAEIRPESWPNRLVNGDMSAWREMLIGRFKNNPQSKQLLEIVEDEGKWRASRLSQLPVSRRGQRCEAWFYEAMHAKRDGQLDYMRYCLKKSLEARVQAYDEYAMAAFLLGETGAPVRSSSSRVPSSGTFASGQFSASRH